MTRPRLLALFVFATATLTAALSTPAAVTVYTDRAAFEAAIGPHVTYTFEPGQGFPTAPGYVPAFGPVTAMTIDGAGQLVPAQTRVPELADANQTLSGHWATVGGNFELTNSLFLTFSPPLRTIGFDFYTLGLPGFVTATVEGPLGRYDAQYPVSGLPHGFLGLTSPDPIVGLHIYSSLGPRDQINRGIDNLTLVPEPAAFAGLFGTVALSLSSRRITGGIA